MLDRFDYCQEFSAGDAVVTLSRCKRFTVICYHPLGTFLYLRENGTNANITGVSIQYVGELGVWVSEYWSCRQSLPELLEGLLLFLVPLPLDSLAR